MTENKKNMVGFGVMTALAIGFIVCAAPLYHRIQAAVKAGVSYTAGTYAGIARGFGGDVIALVTVDAGGILDVELIGEGETPDLGGVALQALAPAFVEKKDSKVDGISGSTITSNAAIVAVRSALDQAAGKEKIVDTAAILADLNNAAGGDEFADVGDYFHNGGLRTGLATTHSMNKSGNAGETDGVAQVESVVAAVVIDQEGRIISCKLDTVQSAMNFTSEGKVIMKDEFKSKKELGYDYGMQKASGIGREWHEQAEAIEAYVVGKTAKEIAGIAVDEAGRTTDVDLISGATIKLTSYQKTIIKAIRNAEEIGTEAGDELGLAVVTNMSKSKDATTDADGQCQAYSVYMAVTTDKDGRITGSILDSSQGTVKFNTSGVITSDLDGVVKTKRELGDAYGMKNASGIGKEWYQQADAFEEYMVGKTAAEIGGIAVNESGKTTDTDLMASVTVAIGDFQIVAQKAMQDAGQR